jgi:hypothetical protein
MEVPYPGGPDDEGSLGGMIAVVEENQPGEFISRR